MTISYSYNAMATPAGNPFIANMQITGARVAAQYKQMNDYHNAIKAQLAVMAKNTNTVNNNRINYQINTNTTGNVSNIWNSPASNFSSIQDNGESDLKPGLFKGALAGKEALVTRLCRKYGVSPALVASIIGLESGWGTSNLAMHNNFGGLRKAGDLGANAKGFGYFSTPERGLEEMIKNLASYSRRFSDVKNVDFANLDAIGRHYCEGGNWANKVREMYSKNVQNYLA